MIDLYPIASDAYYYLGKVYVQNKNFTEAIKKLNKAIEYSPNSYDSNDLYDSTRIEKLDSMFPEKRK